MSTQITGKDFQSWGAFEFAIDGLTVIVGPSNLGKSALYRAFKGLVRNLLNAGQIRVGSDGLEITAVIDGHTITARRPNKKTGSNSYVIDGEPWDKLQKAIPEPIEDLNLGEIEIGSVKLDPIFAGQFGTQFMLETTAPEMTAILGAFSSTEKLEAGKRAANVKIGEKNAQAKVLATESRLTSERADKLAPLVERADAIQAAVDALEPVVRVQERTVGIAGDLISHMETFINLQHLADRLTLPDTQHAARGIQLVGGLTLVGGTLAHYEALRSTLDRLTLPDTQQAARDIRIVENLDQASTALSSYELRKTTLDHLVIPNTGSAEITMKQTACAAIAHDAKRRGDAGERSLKTIAETIEVWVIITTIYNKIRAFEKTAGAYQSLEESEVRAHRVDGRLPELTVGIEDGTKLLQRIKAIESVTAARVSRTTHEMVFTAANEQWEHAQSVLAQIQQAYEAHKLEHAAQKHGLTCPKCGTVVD